MSVYAGPEISSNGLVGYWDAGNINSYSGSGTVWADLSGSGNHLTLVNAPTFTTNVFQFNGTNQYAYNNLNLSTGTSTIIGASRYLSNSGGRIISASNNNWLVGNYSNFTETFYAGGWVAQGAGSYDTNWRILAATNDVSGDVYSLYINGVSRSVANPSGGSVGPNGICIGCYKPALTEFANGQCSFVLAYNRVLSAEEIKQNFNALRGRFGL